ncbi:MAG: ammonia-forming cytochrome c nitrite reductase subunit c552, partial [Myxococcales bacterium]
MTKHVAVWLSVLLLAIGSQVSAEAEPVQDARPLPGGQCLTCHLTVDDKLGELWATDIHAQAGIGCVDCHGGDPNAEVSEKAKRAGTGYRGIPSPLEITRLCGGCHADV